MSYKWESWPFPSVATAALRRVNPACHLGSTISLTLLTGTDDLDPQSCMRDLVRPFSCHRVEWLREKCPPPLAAPNFLWHLKELALALSLTDCCPWKSRVDVHLASIEQLSLLV